jgi:hypothetical protein
LDCYSFKRLYIFYYLLFLLLKLKFIIIAVNILNLLENLINLKTLELGLYIFKRNVFSSFKKIKEVYQIEFHYFYLKF